MASYPKIEQEKESTTAVGSYNHVVTLPDTKALTVGNLLIMVCSYDCSSTTLDNVQWVTPPSGWTYLQSANFYYKGVCYLARQVNGGEGATATYTTADGEWNSGDVVYEISGAAALASVPPACSAGSYNFGNVSIDAQYKGEFVTDLFLLIAAGAGDGTASETATFDAGLWELGQHDMLVGTIFFGTMARQASAADFPTAGTYIQAAGDAMSHGVGLVLHVPALTPKAISAAGPFLEFYDTGAAAWVDISAYVMSWKVEWGAFGPIDQQRARTIDVLLLNTDRRFEPAYADGAYYPEILPGAYIYCGLNVTTSDGTVEYPLFWGIAESWSPTYLGQKVGVCELRACDPTKVAVSDWHTGTLPSNPSNTQLSTILTCLEWSGTYLEDFETGDATLQEYELAHEPLWGVAQSIIHSEGGWFYWLPTSEGVTARFLNRDYLIGQEGVEDVYYFDDFAACAQYTDIRMSANDDRVYTRAVMCREGGIEQGYENTVLSAAIGERIYNESGLLLATNPEVAARAQAFVTARSTSIYKLFVTELTCKITPGFDGLFHAENAMGLTVPLARIDITHTPPVGSVLNFDCRVVGGSISQREPKAPIVIVGSLIEAEEFTKTET